jgi:phosphoglycerate dehydrogenase-like enzyme
MKYELLVLFAPPSAVPFREDQLDRLRAAHPRVRVEVTATPEAWAARLPEAGGVIGWFGSTAGLLARAPRLRWLQAIGVGAEALLIPELVAAEHVALTASKGPLGGPIGEHAVALLLALARCLPALGRHQAAGRWQREAPMTELAGATVAVLGLGAVGGTVARICRAGFGMRVVGLVRTPGARPHVDRTFERRELAGALAEADAVVLALPLTPATERIVDAAGLATMRPGAFLVNVGRGRLVDEAALIEALRAGRLAGAGLDVAATEPPPPDSPLWTLPNVLLTPHQAPFTNRVTDHQAAFWCENIRRFAEGRPLLGLVDRRLGY